MLLAATGIDCIAPFSESAGVMVDVEADREKGFEIGARCVSLSSVKRPFCQLTRLRCRRSKKAKYAARPIALIQLVDWTYSD